MPHARNRHALKLIKKRLGFSRVVSLQGSRQTGKSFLAREILAKELPDSEYLTFDRGQDRRMAENSPESFLALHQDSRPLIVDEAQKVPDLFDAIKFVVDEDPAPGRFVLLGSTEFSRETKIRESLTGRLSKVRIFPFNLAEAEGLEPNVSSHPLLIHRTPRLGRAAVMRHLQQGGFPGIFSVRDRAIRQILWDDWIKLTCERDILQSRNPISPALADQVFRSIPRLETPNLASISKKVGKSPKTVLRALGQLQTLFAIQRIEPHPLGTGKPLYLWPDCGLTWAATQDQGLMPTLRSWLWCEQLSQRSYSGGDTLTTRLAYYRGSRGGIIDFIVDSGSSISALKLFEYERIDERDFEILRAFKVKALKAGYKSVRLVALGPYTATQNLDGIELAPWEALG